jgi:hypothetical protein
MSNMHMPGLTPCDTANRWPLRVLAFDDFHNLPRGHARSRQRSLILCLVRSH